MIKIESYFFALYASSTKLKNKRIIFNINKMNLFKLIRIKNNNNNIYYN